MTPFELVEPASLKEAIALIDPDDPDVRPIAGGTALMLMMKAGVFHPRRLVSLRRLNGVMTGISTTTSGDLHIGAMTSLAAVEHSPDVVHRASAIARAMKWLSNVRVRNVATVGGALAHGDPHMDLPPVAIALDARVRVAGSDGERELAVEELCTGYYETALRPNELIVSFIVPMQGARRAAYLKVTASSADDWPALGVAVAIDVDGDIIKSARVVVSAATAKATRLAAVEKLLTSAAISDRLLRDAGGAAAAEADIIGDLRGSAAYKRELLRIYIGRAVRAAKESKQ
jgi:carbon-monoxide dehydrogenase medium subunit